jgi:hypothetical protein
MTAIGVEEAKWHETVPASPIAYSVLEDLRFDCRAICQRQGTSRWFDWQRVLDPLPIISQTKMTYPAETIAVCRL